MTVEVFAPAKINLALHVTGQRADGYHLLDTLVAFGPVGDRLNIQNGNILSLTVEGPEALGVPADMSNLVMKAAEFLGEGRGASLLLEKILPVASGIGGGSSDAAAALRGLLVHWNNTEFDDLSDEALTPLAEHIIGLGADVPMCLLPVPLRARGIGEKVDFIREFPALPAILVNPRVPVSTPEIFQRLTGKDNDPMPEALPEWAGVVDFCSWLATTRNDLQGPALSLHPEIGVVLNALAASDGALFARMSGSGATCFAIYPDKEAAQDACAKIRADRPNWWITSGCVGNQLERSRPLIS